MNEEANCFDVIIVGGGPGGTAAGLTLLKRGGVSVCVVEASAYESPRIGESLTPGMRPLLEYLDVWGSFYEEQTLESFGSQAAWGSKEPGTLDYLFTLHGTGWALDRVALDRLLANTFADRGGQLLTETHFSSCARCDGGWKVQIRAKNGIRQTLRGRFLIDATGRRGRVARHLGVSRTAYDQLVGVARLGGLPAGRSMESMVLVEACDYGWWYTAPVPGDQISAVLMTDADLARELKAAGSAQWNLLMREMAETSRRLSGVEFCQSPTVSSASSSCLTQVGGEGWVAVGDAVSSFDPLSSTGIPHAMGSGTQGAIVAADALFAEGRALEAYAEAIRMDFVRYLKTHWRYYQREKRWPTSTFWKRRRTGVSIDPYLSIQEIVSGGEIPFTHSVHLPERLLRQLHSSFDKEHSAHQAVGSFSALHPEVSDQRIILGLQDLVTPGEALS